MRRNAVLQPNVPAADSAARLLTEYTAGSSFFFASPQGTLLAQQAFAVVPEGAATLAQRVSRSLDEAWKAGHPDPVVVGAMPFDLSAPARLVVARNLRSAGRLSLDPSERMPAAAANQYQIRMVPEPVVYMRGVETALERIAAGTPAKVVLSRTLELTSHSAIAIEPLLRCAGVREATVIGCVLPGGAKRLSAWLVADEPQPTQADLRRQLQTVLPASVIPSDLRFLDRLPRNRNGKIDRAALQRMPVTQAPEPVSAASPMEREILAVWQQVLGVRELSTQDDFFDLGGQSLQAIQVVNRLGVRIGREVSIAALFRHPTATALASFLERESAIDGQGLGVLLPMADQGERPPLFCVHPAGGLSWCYLGLTRILPDQPLYGLQARGLEAAEPLPARLEEMARDYLSQIRCIQPAGPYHILGWSVGGAIAHTMAAMLQADGEEVGLLAMLDAYPGDQWCHLEPPGEQDALTALLNIAGHERNAYRGGTLDRAGVMALLSRAGGPLASLDPARLAALIDIATNNIRLLRQCRHGVFRGDVLFFTAAKPRPESWLTRDSWSAYVDGRIENVDIDCTHPAMLNPSSLAVIGPILRSRMAAIR